MVHGDMDQEYCCYDGVTMKLDEQLWQRAEKESSRSRAHHSIGASSSPPELSGLLSTQDCSTVCYCVSL